MLIVYTPEGGAYDADMPAMRTLIGLLTLFSAATPVLAQDVPKAPETEGWVVVLISMVLIVAVGVASFMSSKRGHQD